MSIQVTDHPTVEVGAESVAVIAHGFLNRTCAITMAASTMREFGDRLPEQRATEILTSIERHATEMTAFFAAVARGASADELAMRFLDASGTDPR